MFDPKNDSLDWRPGPVKNLKTCHRCDVTKRQPYTHIKSFFSIETERLVESVDGLNSFLAQSAGEL